MVVYSIKECKAVATLDWDGSIKNDLAFSTDGAKLVLAANDDIRVWEWRKKKQLAWPEALTRQSPSHSARFGARENLVYVGNSSDNWRGGVRLWDTEKGRLPVVFEPDAPPSPNEIVGGTAMASTRDGALLAVKYRNQLVLIDTKTHKVLKRSEHDLPAKNLAFSPDGKFLAQRPIEDKSITLWSVPELKQLNEYDIRPGQLWGCDFLPDGRLLILATPVKHDEYHFIWWDGVKNEEVWRIFCAKGNNLFQGFCISPDGKWLALGFDPSNVQERKLTLWRMEDIHRLAAGKSADKK